MDNSFKLKSGDIVGDFKVIQQLGVGGMGQVYLALDIANRCDVALKILPKSDPNYDFWLIHFEREKEIYEAIDHPNVVKFITAGETDRFQFMVLEHILGISMRTKLDREGPSGLVSTFSWMEELVLALHATHQKGIIHRDLKPDNIMVTRDLDIKLIDFGIARHVPKPQEVTNEPWVGTLAYSAPETIMRHPITQRADIYSAGLLFYEMITGRSLIHNPFDKEEVLKEMRHLESLGQVLPDKDDSALYKEVDKLLYDMLRYSPVDRVASTGMLLARMEEIAERVGGSVLVLSQDEAKRAAQREIADAHFWKALNLLSDRKLVVGINELANIAVFSRAMAPVTRNMFIAQLDVLLLNVKGEGRKADDPFSLWPEDFFNIFDKLLDLAGKVYEPHQLYAREYIVCKRIQEELDADGIERFLQTQVVRRQRSYVFHSAYMRVISNISKQVAKDVWLRFLKELIHRGSLCEAGTEMEEIKKVLGKEAVDRETADLHEELFSKQIAQRADFQELLKKVEETHSLEQVRMACETFLAKHPQSIATLRKLYDTLLALDEDERAQEVESRLGATIFQCGTIEDAEKIFVRILKSRADNSEAALYLYACMKARKESPKIGAPDYPVDMGALHKLVRRRYGLDN